MKRNLFSLNKNEEDTCKIGEKIYSLMYPCFEPEKFDNNYSCESETIENQAVVSSDSCNLETKRLIMTEQLIDKTEIKHLREFLKSIPQNYKWGDKATNGGGGRPSLKRSNELNKVKINRATIREMKRLINEKENKSKLTRKR
jgi:hypothetical protein